ncbi:MAG: glycosyltransferase family 4 protein [Methanobacterium sp.]
MNILITFPGDLTRPQGGGANRSYNLAKQLQNAGHNITVLQPQDNKENTGEFEIFNYTGNILGRDLSVFADLNPFFIFKIIKLLLKKDTDLVHVELPWGATAVNIINRLFGKKAKVVYSSHNYEAGMQKDLRDYHRNLNESGFFKVLIFNLIYPYTKLIERCAVKLSDIVVCVSNSDKESMASNYKSSNDKIKVIHNGTDFTKILKSSRNKEIFGLDKNKISIVFHGSYEHLPNYEAINLIKDKIYPEFRKQLDKVEFVIAGVGVPVSSKNEGLRLIGFVEDIYSLLKSSDIAIVPILHGAGTKLKILDYMGVGLPIVSTDKGMEGINAVNYEHAVIVEDINTHFIEAINYLIENKEERKRIGSNGKQMAEKEYGWDSIGQKLNDLYNKIV